MRDDQLRERLASYGARGEELAHPPEPAAIRRRARRHYGGRVLAVVAVALLTFAGVQAVRTALVGEVPPVRPAPAPSSFVAGDAHGRLVVVSGDTGKALRVLAPPRADYIQGIGLGYRPVVPGDRSAAYYGGACTGVRGTVWRQPLDGGRPTKVADGRGTSLTVSEDGSTLAWVDQRCNGLRQERVTVRDLRRGTERHWPLEGVGEAYGLTLSPDGRRLAMILSAAHGPFELRVLDTTGQGGLLDGRLLHLPDAGCQPEPPLAYRPGSGQLAVVESCGPLNRSQLRLVYVDEATGTVRARPPVFPAWVAMTGVIAGLDFDHSGTQLIYGLSRNNALSTWEYRQGGSVKLADGYAMPTW
jgi:hypothetical protein